MEPGDVEAVKNIFSLLKSGGDFVLMGAAFYIWRQNERLTKLETLVSILMGKKEPTL